MTRPIALERGPGHIAATPVTGSCGRSFDQERSRFVVAEIPALVIDDPKFITGNGNAARARHVALGGVGQEDVQHLGRTDAVEDRDAETFLEPGERLGRK